MARQAQSTPEEYEKVGETLFLVLDRLIDLEKPQLLANVFVAYLGDHLTAIDLQRLAQAIDLAHTSDLHELIGCSEAVLNGNDMDATNLPWMQMLGPSGLTIARAGGVGVVRTRYELTPLGQLLWRAVRYKFPQA